MSARMDHIKRVTADYRELTTDVVDAVKKPWLKTAICSHIGRQNRDIDADTIRVTVDLIYKAGNL